MSAYINCPKCYEDTLDVDTLSCDCGYGHHEDSMLVIRELQQRILDLENQLQAYLDVYGGDLTYGKHD